MRPDHVCRSLREAELRTYHSNPHHSGHWFFPLLGLQQVSPVRRHINESGQILPASAAPYNPSKHPHPWKSFPTVPPGVQFQSSKHTQTGLSGLTAEPRPSALAETNLDLTHLESQHAVTRSDWRSLREARPQMNFPGTEKRTKSSITLLRTP